MNRIKLTLASFLVAQTIFGADLNWNTTNGIWSNPSNWVESVIPQNGDTLTFLVSTGSKTNDLNGLILSGITFNTNTPGSLLGNPITFQDAFLNFAGGFGNTCTFAIPATVNGTLTIDANNVNPINRISSTFSGTGNIVKTGVGGMNITGALATTGSLRVSGGSLSLLGGTTSLSADAVIVESSGSLALNSGTTVIDDLSGSGAITLPTDGVLTLDANATITFPGRITGANGSVVKTGLDSLILGGANTYGSNRSTTVSQGTLALLSTGSLASPVTVSAGATLRGVGTISRLVTVDGTVRPGNSIGTQNYGAGLTINDNGILAIEIDASGGSTAQSLTSIAAVTGTATLNSGAILQVIGQTGTTYSEFLTYPPFLTATAISGTFDSTISTNLPFLFSVNYTSTTATLDIESIIQIPTADLTGNNLALANYLNTPSVGDYLVSTPAGWVDGTFTTLLNLSGDAQIDALEKISPSRLTFAAFAGQNTAFQLSQLIALHTSSHHLFRTERELANQARLVQGMSEEEFLAANDQLGSFWPVLTKSANPEELVEEPVREEKASAVYSIWVNGFGNFAEQAEENQNPQFDMNTGGILAGFERDYTDLQKTLLDDCILGGALGYTNTSIREDQHYGHGTTQSGFGSLYGAAYLNNGLSYDFSVLGSYQRIESLRNVSYSNYSAGSQSAHNGFGGNLHGGLSYEHPFEKWKAFALLSPFINADWAFISENAYTEHGSNSFNMNINSRFSSMLRFEAGLNLYFRWFLEKGLLTLREAISYVNKVPLGTGTLTAAIVGAPGSFTVTAFTDMQNLFSPSIELSLRSKRGAYVSLMYDGEFGSGYMSNQVAVKLGRSF